MTRADLRPRTAGIARHRSAHARPRRPSQELVHGARPIEFVKLSPASNTTLLVTSRHAKSQYPSIARQLMRTEHVHAEQVGFVLPPRAPSAQTRLHMAGDELCANACMSLAALHAATSTGRGKLSLRIETSGAEQPLHSTAQRLEAGYRCQLQLPLPQQIEPYPLSGAAGCALVRYPDAVHLIIECQASDRAERHRARRLALEMASTQGTSVIGIMLSDPSRGELAPLVNVPALGSLVWESSCGSGTAALGAYLAAQAGSDIAAEIKQPGGTMHVKARCSEAAITDLWISTDIQIVAQGTAYIHD